MGTVTAHRIVRQQLLRFSVVLATLLLATLAFQAAAKADVQIGVRDRTLTVYWPGDEFRSFHSDGDNVKYYTWLTPYGGTLRIKTIEIHEDPRTHHEDWSYVDRDANDGCHRNANDVLSLSDGPIYCSFRNFDNIRVIGTPARDEIAVDQLDSDFSVRVDSNEGDDLVYFNTNRGLLDTGVGNDKISASGNRADGSAGDTANAVLLGGPGNDDITIHRRALRVDGGDGNDEITGGPNHDEISGGDGEDTISGLGGNDSLSGADGDDTITGADGDDTITGGTGQDFIDAGNGNDGVLGFADADTIFGRDGNDTIFGGDDGDRINGGNGNDRLLGERGVDWIFSGNGNDTALGGDQTDLIIGDNGDDNLSGEAGDDIVIDRQGQRDDVSGGAGNDYLYAQDALGSAEEHAFDEDVLDGGPGDDRLVSRDNYRDLLYCGDGTDIFSTDVLEIDPREALACESGTDLAVDESGDEDSTPLIPQPSGGGVTGGGSTGATPPVATSTTPKSDKPKKSESTSSSAKQDAPPKGK